MSYYTRIVAAPAGPLAPGTQGLILVDAALGPYTIELPQVRQSTGRLYFYRLGSSENVVTLAPQAGDAIEPAEASAPNVVLRRGRMLALVGDGGTTWRLLESVLSEMIREMAVASLLDYGTLAGANVESERVDPIEGGDVPRIIVYGDDSAEGISRAGTAPAFQVTLTLAVQALIERAVKGDAVAELDTLIAQIKDALLGDPIWVQLSENIPSVRITRTFKGENKQIIGDGRVVITCTWREIYPPRVVTPLRTITLTTEPRAGTQDMSVTIDLAQS